VADEAVGRAGVLLRTAGGQVDATVQAQWIRILDEILAGWQEHWLLSPALLASAEAALASDRTVVEEIGPAEVEQIDLDKVEEIDPNDVAE